MSQTDQSHATPLHPQSPLGSGISASSDSSGTAETVAELKALVAGLAARVQTLEEQADQRHPEVSEDVLLAISAAIAAYLGKRGIIKQVHLRRGSTWAATGRVAAQEMHAELHGYGDRQTTLTPHARRGTT